MPKPLTLAEWVRTLEAIKQEPTRGEAAALLGINENSLRKRVTVARANGWELPPERSPQKVAKGAYDRDAEMAKLRDENERLEQALEEARRAKLPTLPRAKTPSRNRKSTLVVAVPDVHGSQAHKPSLAALYADLETLKPDKVVLLGDQMDCGGFLAQHQTLGFVAETEYSVEDDALATNAHLDRIQSLCSDVVYLEGNHEQRLEKWCVTQGLRSKRDSGFLLEKFGPRALFNIKQRGIRYYSRSKFYDNLQIRGTHQHGHCLFTHGECTGVNAARAHLSKWQCNLVYGHTHRPDMAMMRTPLGGLIAAWSPGCLSEYNPFWRHTGPTGWSHGYLLMDFSQGGHFHAAHVPIEDGKSFLPARLIGA